MSTFADQDCQGNPWAISLIWFVPQVLNQPFLMAITSKRPFLMYKEIFEGNPRSQESKYFVCNVFADLAKFAIRLLRTTTAWQ